MLSPPEGMRTEYCGHIARDPKNETSGDVKEPEKREKGGRRGREIRRKRERDKEREKGRDGKGERGGGERDTKNQEALMVGIGMQDCEKEQGSTGVSAPWFLPPWPRGRSHRDRKNFY